MLRCSCSFAHSLNRTSPLLTFLTKVPMSICQNSCPTFLRPLPQFRSRTFAKPLNSSSIRPFNSDMNMDMGMDMDIMDRRRNHLCCFASSAATAPLPESPALEDDKTSRKAKKKALRESPEMLLRVRLNACSKHRSLVEALRLYDEARINGVQLNQHHYNVLLYLCSSDEVSVEGDEAVSSDLGIKRGFEIFQQMVADKVTPNEATFTNAARLAMAMEDPEMAFDLIRKMKTFNIPPRLRSYGPALFGFCKKGMPDRAYEVDAHMAESGGTAEEPELSALLKLSADEKRADKVYEMMQRLRATVRQVAESTASIIEDWFKSKDAAKLGEKDWDLTKIKEGVVRGGGGWHGQGWLGSGHWRVGRTQVNEKGVCHACGEKLVCIDIDPRETENFARSLKDLACQREGRTKSDFIRFQGWLQEHGPFDAVIDGANIGLSSQHSFSFIQLNAVVNRLRRMSPSNRLPLIVLHKSRVTGGPAQNPNNKKLLETWKKSGALFATPPGSNDDWYWLYAAVSCKCLIVTNDEMRDHLFQLLGTSFFPRWKEKHQVRLSVSRDGLKLHMPPPYSIVIQESENGSWHVPTVTGDDVETPRQWLCASRSKDV